MPGNAYAPVTEETVYPSRQRGMLVRVMHVEAGAWNPVECFRALSDGTLHPERPAAGPLWEAVPDEPTDLVWLLNQDGWVRDWLPKGTWVLQVYGWDNIWFLQRVNCRFSEGGVKSYSRWGGDDGLSFLPLGTGELHPEPRLNALGIHGPRYRVLRSSARLEFTGTLSSGVGRYSVTGPTLSPATMLEAEQFITVGDFRRTLQASVNDAFNPVFPPAPATVDLLDNFTGLPETRPLGPVNPALQTTDLPSGAVASLDLLYPALPSAGTGAWVAVGGWPTLTIRKTTPMKVLFANTDPWLGGLAYRDILLDCQLIQELAVDGATENTPDAAMAKAQELVSLTSYPPPGVNFANQTVTLDAAGQSLVSPGEDLGFVHLGAVQAATHAWGGMATLLGSSIARSVKTHADPTIFCNLVPPLQVPGPLCRRVHGRGRLGLQITTPNVPGGIQLLWHAATAPDTLEVAGTAYDARMISAAGVVDQAWSLFCPGPC